MTRVLDGLLELSGDEVRALAAHAADPGPARPELAGRVVAVLPFGPTALPAAAWIAAAGRLGAGVVRAEDFDRSVADDFDVCVAAARWADVLVVSHQLAGFARAVAEMTGRPVVNAGEGDGEDPAGGISVVAAALPAVRDPRRPLRAAVCGDLAGSRTARAVLSAFAALDATVLLVPAQSHDLPERVVARLARRMRRRPYRFEARSMRSLLDMVDTVLLAREEAPQLPLFGDLGVPPGESERRARRDVEDLDVLFVAGHDGADRLVHEPFRRRRRAGLPAGSEHATSVRALEAALLWAAGELAADEVPAAEAEGDASGGSAPPEPRYRSGLGLVCRGETCVAARRPDRVTPEFAILGRPPRALECRHCGEPATAQYAASKVEGRFHPVGSAYARHVLDANLVLFSSHAEALAAGFEPARRAKEAEA